MLVVWDEPNGGFCLQDLGGSVGEAESTSASNMNGRITEHPPHPRTVSLKMFVLPESGRVSGNDFGGGAAGPS